MSYSINVTTLGGYLDTRSVCARFGVSAALLRLWERRYGWPMPMRTVKGQRRFSPAEVAILSDVLALVRAGTPVGTVLRDGQPQLPAADSVLPGGSELAAAALAALEQPTTAEGRALRMRVVTALRLRDVGSALACCHEALHRCRSNEQTFAVWAPVEILLHAWEENGRPLIHADRLREVLEHACQRAA